MQKAIYIFLEILCWLQLFLAPVLVTSIVFFVVVLHAGELRPAHFFMLVPGMMAGLFLAERTRRRTGCYHFIQGFTRSED